MPYATKQQLVDRFGEAELIRLTDKNVPRGNWIVDQVLDGAIADADSVIDSHLQSRYTLPLGAVPTVLTRFACDLVRYFLYDDGAPDHVKTRYDNAMSFLKAVARGEVNLGLSAAGATAKTNDVAQVETGATVFGRDDDGFI